MGMVTARAVFWSNKPNPAVDRARAGQSFKPNSDISAKTLFFWAPSYTGAQLRQTCVALHFPFHRKDEQRAAHEWPRLPLTRELRETNEQAALPQSPFSFPGKILAAATAPGHHNHAVEHN
jgi:hypothetical protein